jgi:hypothetical protein
MQLRVLLVAMAACGGGSRSGPWLSDAHVIVDGVDETNLECRAGPCGHDENTDLIVFGGATYLVHRTARTQLLGPNSALRVYRSDDHGEHWSLLAVIPAPLDRDVRDPSFYVIGGQLAIKAITRLPVASFRDTDVDSISVVTRSSDGGGTWTPFQRIGPDTWSFWRVRDDLDGVHYSAAYEDGDRSVKLFSSADGLIWNPGAVIYGVSADSPLETELVFGDAGVTALVRVDGKDDELVGAQGRLRTIVCTAPRPYTRFDCSRVLDGVRLDGPIAFDYHGRTFVIARKHLLGIENRKRTALYELTLSTIVEHGELPSAGDTAYAGVAPIDGSRFLVTYYSSNIADDPPWVRAVFGPTDIRQATVDLSRL